MLCPHCKINLQTLTLKDTNIDICPSCHGVWLDKGELEKLIETHAPIFNGAGQAYRTGCDKEEKLYEGEIECPRCKKLMQKYRYAYTSY
jgi:Zn-finger nucleic acid-binding protein